jgi:hypothetical protein
MNAKCRISAIVLVVTFSLLTALALGKAQVTKGESLPQGEKGKGIMLWNFENVPAGQLPTGWKVEGTNQKGPLATWKVIEDKTAPSGTHVLAMTSPNHTSGKTFNICWTKKVSFLDGEIQVRFKAVKGKRDQGGGVMWRVRDKNNYYIARFNPLENNFRIYYVRNGVRRMIASVKIVLPAGKWHTLKIVQRGNRFEGYLNGKKLLQGTNEVFTKPGGVGLWTKADAVTSFDDFIVRPLKEKFPKLNNRS